jgi:chromate reductase, NAD(P)H dehydrogenase (quinone)
MGTNKKIVALSGSIRENSSHQKALHSLKNYIPKGVDYEIYEGVQKLPHFNPDLDNEHPPDEVQLYREILSKADGVIFCTPEYI